MGAPESPTEGGARSTIGTCSSFGAVSPAHGVGAAFVLSLPPRFPEPNPAENIWRFMRDDWPSNRIFESHDQIISPRRGAGKSSSTNPGQPCPSGAENGCMGSDQCTLVISHAETRLQAPFLRCQFDI